MTEKRNRPMTEEEFRLFLGYESTQSAMRILTHEECPPIEPTAGTDDFFREGRRSPAPGAE